MNDRILGMMVVERYLSTFVPCDLLLTTDIYNEWVHHSPNEIGLLGIRFYIFMLKAMNIQSSTSSKRK